MYKARLVLVDESVEVSKALELLVAACNEIGSLICELNREVSNAGGDTSPSATDDEEDMRAEAKLEEVPVKKKAAKETGERGQERNCTTSVITKAATKDAVIDLSLSDEEETVVVKNEPMKEESEVKDHAAIEIEESSVTPADDGEGSMADQVNCEEKQDSCLQEEVSGPPPRKKARKRMTPRDIVPIPEPKKVPKKAARDVVIRLRKRAEMVPGGDIGEAVRSALNAAIAVEENVGEVPSTRAFVAATAEAERKLVEVHMEHPVQAERHLEDMRLLMSVAAVNLKKELSPDEVRESWKMLKTLQKLHDHYPVKTKGLHRNCLQLNKYLVTEHEIPAFIVKKLKARLDKLFSEVDEWIPLDGLNTKWFDKHMSLVNKLLGGRFEGWNPHTEPILGKTVANLERICTFGIGDAWNDRYASICLACSKMSRSTFFWTFDLAEEITNRLIRCNQLEPGFEGKDRVEEDFKHVTSYDQEVQHASDPSAKLAAFDELIDRLRWIFNAVAMTREQSLVPLTRLVRLNECFGTLGRLCDNGNALNLEGCLHLEKLLVVMRQVMYIRIDYAKVSKRATDSLLGLFPRDQQSLFVYPDGCRTSIVHVVICVFLGGMKGIVMKAGMKPNIQRTLGMVSHILLQNIDGPPVAIKLKRDTTVLHLVSFPRTSIKVLVGITVTCCICLFSLAIGLLFYFVRHDFLRWLRRCCFATLMFIFGSKFGRLCELHRQY